VDSSKCVEQSGEVAEPRASLETTLLDTPVVEPYKSVQESSLEVPGEQVPGLGEAARIESQVEAALIQDAMAGMPSEEPMLDMVDNMAKYIEEVRHVFFNTPVMDDALLDNIVFVDILGVEGAVEPAPSDRSPFRGLGTSDGASEQATLPAQDLSRVEQPGQQKINGGTFHSRRCTCTARTDPRRTRFLEPLGESYEVQNTKGTAQYVATPRLT
jgi:hypothetical protein